jgi:hypothetical protein
MRYGTACLALWLAGATAVGAADERSGHLERSSYSVSDTFDPARPRLSVKTGALVGAGLGAMVMAVHLHQCEDCSGLGDLGKTAAVTVLPGAVLGALVGAALSEERPGPWTARRSPALRFSWRVRF